MADVKDTKDQNLSQTISRENAGGKTEAGERVENDDKSGGEKASGLSAMGRLMERLLGSWRYFNSGVWADNRPKWWIKPVRTLNLSMRSFLNSDIQSQACAMTYRTFLALVPALALFLAIGKGFGLQNYIQQELLNSFPAQQQAINQFLSYVDNYLARSSGGVFVGVGVVFLLFTVINLLNNVENVFNLIFGVKQGRTLGRKISDYTAMLLILPVILICSGGLSMMLSSGIRSLLDIAHVSFLAEIFIEFGSWLMICFFFTGVYVLVPNIKVNVKYAFIAGLLAGSGFMILQWVFTCGIVYVSSYNAIYGSFAFLPLFLIWMQLVWVVCLVGAVICYSSQNVYSYSFTPDSSTVAPAYRRKIIIAIMAVIARRFKDTERPITITEFVRDYKIPSKLLTNTCSQLVRAHLVNVVQIDRRTGLTGYSPGRPLAQLTVHEVFSALDAAGEKDFIPDFNVTFSQVDKIINKMEADFERSYGNLSVADIPFTEPPRTENIGFAAPESSDDEEA